MQHCNFKTQMTVSIQQTEKSETDQGLIWDLLDYIFSIVMGQQNNPTTPTI